MLKPRSLAAATVCLAGLSSLWFSVAQDFIHRPPPPTDLKILQIGDGKNKSGIKILFKVYEAPDGNKGRSTYIKFDSLEGAQQQVEDWAKLPSSITSREHKTYRYGYLVSDRMTAIGELPDSHKKEFMIIRRDGLECYLIESESSQVATKIEDLIGYK